MGTAAQRTDTEPGEPIDAQTALNWGLINRVTPQGKVMEVALELAARLASLPNVALQAAKKAIDLSFDMDESEAIQQTLPLSEQVFQSDDAAEGGQRAGLRYCSGQCCLGRFVRIRI